MKPIRSLALAAGLSLAATPALAGGKDSGGGPLSQVVNGLKQQSGQTGGGGGGGGASGEPSRPAPGAESGWSGGGGGVVYEPGYAGYPVGGETDSSLYLGLHSVEGSNGAMAASLRSSWGDNGLQLDGIRYYERLDTGDYLSMDMWSIAIAHRAIAMDAHDRTSLWLNGGLAGIHSDGLQLFGGVIGAEVIHKVGPELGVEGSVRYYLVQDDIRALEARAGVALSILRVSYRLLDFNVGPPLRGPEVGVALSF